MRAPCATQKSLPPGNNPFDVKWSNCLYEGEPLPLDNHEAVKNFKKLCSPLFKGDDHMALCCNPEQLTILKKDLMSAEALLGSCPSCYFNFRMMWCHMACSPNQSDFVIPTKVELKERTNFTLALFEYELQDESEYVWTGEEDEVVIESNLNSQNETFIDKTNNFDTRDVILNENTFNTALLENLNNQFEIYSSRAAHGKLSTNRIKRDILDSDYTQVVTEIAFYISQIFLDNFVDSCRFKYVFF